MNGRFGRSVCLWVTYMDGEKKQRLIQVACARVYGSPTGLWQWFDVYSSLSRGDQGPAQRRRVLVLFLPHRIVWRRCREDGRLVSKCPPLVHPGGQNCLLLGIVLTMYKVQTIKREGMYL